VQFFGAVRCQSPQFSGSFASIAARSRSFGCGHTLLKYDFRTARGVKSPGGNEPPARGPVMWDNTIRTL